MGQASRRKWMNRHARRVLELVAQQQPKNEGDKAPVFEAAVAQAFEEVQDRRAALGLWRRAGGGLRDLLVLEGARP